MNKMLVWWHLRKVLPATLILGTVVSVAIVVFPDAFINSRYTFTAYCLMSSAGGCFGDIFYPKNGSVNFLLSRGYLRDELWFVKLFTYLLAYVLYMIPQIFVAVLVFGFEINFVELSYMQVGFLEFIGRLLFLSTGFFVMGASLVFVQGMFSLPMFLKWFVVFISCMALFAFPQNSLIFKILAIDKFELITLYIFLFFITVFIRRKQWRYMEVSK